MDIGVSTVIGIAKRVLKPLTGPLAKLVFDKCFRAAYEVSTLYCHHRELLGRWPKTLGGHLEYDVHLKSMYKSEPQTCPLIWVRSASNRVYDKVTLRVEACGGKDRYQDVVTLVQVGPEPTVAMLSRLPTERVKVSGGMAYFAYDEIRVEVLEMLGEHGVPVSARHQHEVIHPMFDLEEAMGQRKGYVRKYGAMYNARFMEMAIEEELVNMRARAMRRASPRRGLGRVWFYQVWMAKLRFWRKNIGSADALRAELLAYWRELKQMEQRREDQRQSALSL